jgi:hypothetical protein
MKGSFRKDGLACQKWFSDSTGELASPPMMLIVAIPECDKEASVGDTFHRLEKPLREDRSGGPLILPACRRNRWPPSSCRTRSNC